MPSAASAFPTFADVERAARRIAGVAHRTPVFTSRFFDARTGATLHFKCENFQRAGAFKFRGAYNALARLSADDRRRGVLTFSSGNHAQAVALAGALLAVPRVIVMPDDAPAVKRRATEGYGGAVVPYDRTREDREAVGRRIAAERGFTIVPPYDHPDVVAGAGTAAAELFQEAGALDVLFVPCGGGGLLSGSAIAARALSPNCRVIGVEPAAGDDATRSFRTRQLQTVHNPQTVADGARTVSLGSITFPLVLRYASDMTTVDDPALLRAMFLLWERMKLVVEPTGALGAAAALGAGVAIAGARVGVILSGGNVDFTQVPDWLAAAGAASGPADTTDGTASGGGFVNRGGKTE
jgi:threo-3-hydroxy-L-aspartate ammonia-lyase